MFLAPLPLLGRARGRVGLLPPLQPGAAPPCPLSLPPYHLRWLLACSRLRSGAVSLPASPQVTPCSGGSLSQRSYAAFVPRAGGGRRGRPGGDPAAGPTSWATGGGERLPSRCPRQLLPAVGPPSPGQGWVAWARLPPSEVGLCQGTSAPKAVSDLPAGAALRCPGRASRLPAWLKSVVPVLCHLPPGTALWAGAGRAAGPSAGDGRAPLLQRVGSARAQGGAGQGA